MPEYCAQYFIRTAQVKDDVKCFSFISRIVLCRVSACFTLLELIFTRVIKCVFLNFSLRSNIVGLAMSIVIIFSYLVILAPAREHIENAVLRYVHHVENTIIHCLVVRG